MSERPLVDRTHSTTWTFETIADDCRRRCIEILDDRTAEVPVEPLASEIAAKQNDESIATVRADERRRVHTQLVHVHLPKLDDAGLVEWHDDAGTVESADHPALQDPSFQRLIETEGDRWDAVLSSLERTRRRLALAELAADDGPIPRDDLIRRVLAREEGVSTDAVPETSFQDAKVAFHHVHLPKLESAGLIDCEDGDVSYEGHPALDTGWLEVDPAETPQTYLGSLGRAD